MATKKSDNSGIGILALLFLVVNIFFSYKGVRMLYDLNFWQASLISLLTNGILILLNIYLQQTAILKIITLLGFLIACWYDLKIVVLGIEDLLNIKSAEPVIDSIVTANSWTGILLSLVVLSMTAAFSFVFYDDESGD
jgi:hypothetical protein